MPYNKTVIGQRKKPIQETVKRIRFKINSLIFRLKLKLSHWDRWNDEITYFPAFHWTTGEFKNRKEFEWNLRRPFKITYRHCKQSKTNSDIWYFYWFENFKEVEERYEVFNEAEFIEEGWKEHCNMMAGVDIL